jgi:serine carboxypeptidase-like clade 1
MPDLSFGLYSGYLPIEGTKKELHYVAALSKGDWSVDPVVIWFNGGPGCSSMLGWAQEHGPYVIEDGNTTFTPNYYSWNNEANMIYIESPAGVGYSKCPDTTECNFDDDNSADDNLAAVLYLLTQKFPDLQENDLYLAGESYAGVYVPKLAQKIDWYIGNLTDSSAYKPNLKGFIVGNGVTNWKYDGKPAFVEMSYWHGLIDDELYDNLKTCDLTYYDFNYNSLSASCQNWMNEFQSLVTLINVYDVFGKCYLSPTQLAHKMKYHMNHNSESNKFLNAFRDSSEEQSSPSFFTAADYTNFLYRNQDSKKLKSTPNCVYAQPVNDYLNLKEVRQALHIPDDL